MYAYTVRQAAGTLTRDQYDKSLMKTDVWIIARGWRYSEDIPRICLPVPDTISAGTHKSTEENGCCMNATTGRGKIPSNPYKWSDTRTTRQKSNPKHRDEHNKASHCRFLGERDSVTAWSREGLGSVQVLLGWKWCFNKLQKLNKFNIKCFLVLRFINNSPIFVN